MKRLLCIICVLLASLCLLTACTKPVSSIYSKETRESSPTLGKMSEQATVRGRFHDSMDDLILVVEQPVNTDPKYIMRVFNLDTGKIVYEDKAAIVGGEIKLLGHGLFAVKTPAATAKDADTWTVYSETGKELETFVGGISASGELFFAEHCVYCMADGTLKKTDILWNEDTSPLSALGGKLLPGTRVCEKYRFDTNATGCAVYDLGGNLLTTYFFPSYVTGGTTAMLNNGSVLIQYSEKVGKKGDEGIKARDYDYIDASDNLWTLSTFIMNPETGKLRAVRMNGFLTNSATNYQYGGRIAGSIDNIGTFVEISASGQVDTSGAAQKYVIVSNSGVISDVQKLHPAQTGLPTPVGENWWSVRCVDGSSMLFTKSGKLVTSLNGSTQLGYNYVVKSGMILNENGKVIVDLNAQKLTLDRAMKNYAILSDATGNKYVYTDNKLLDLLVNSKETVLSTGDNLILTQLISGSVTTITVYNEKTEKLGSFDNKTVTPYEGENGMYLLVRDDAKQEVTFYKLTK